MGEQLSSALPAMARGTLCDASPGLTREAALAFMLARLHPVAGTETVPLIEALGRVLVDPLTAATDLPSWDNSAMDGYAYRRADVSAFGGQLRIAQRIAAGTVGTPLEPGTAARIFTGAPVPPGADTVAPQEHCVVEKGALHPPPDSAPGANIRRAGEAAQAGAVMIEAGTRLAPQHLGVAASLGAGRLTVRRRLRVAIAATGDELSPLGAPLAHGRIYDSNRYMLAGLLRRLDCTVVDHGVVADGAAATEAALLRAGGAGDLALFSGGVSVGEEDHIKAALARVGALELGAVAIRPGKSIAFGHVGTTPFFGCPGNPVALFVVFCLFVRPILLRLQGVSGDLAPGTFTAPASFDWPRPAGRTEFLRARLIPHPGGPGEIVIHPKRSSAILSSVSWAEGLVEIPAGTAVRRGEPLAFLPLGSLLS